MTRTKVLLALGDHGEPGTYNKDKRFFRNVALPFLDKHAKGRTRGAVVIFEYAVLSGGFNRAGDVNRMLIDWAQNTLNSGKPSNDERHDWGFEDRILELNQVCLRVLCMPELQTQEAMLKGAQAGALYHRAIGAKHRLAQDESFELELEALQLHLEHQLLRDRNIVKMVEEFRTADPGIAVLVTRGRMHKPMIELFDRSAYEVEVKEDKAPDPVWFEAMRNFYKGTLDRLGLENLLRHMHNETKE